MKISFKKTLIYIIGLIVISLGANILLRSRLGAGAWDTVSSNLSQWLHITLGTATAIVYSVVLGFVVLSRKNYGYLFIIGPRISASRKLPIFTAPKPIPARKPKPVASNIANTSIMMRILKNFLTFKRFIMV